MLLVFGIMLYLVLLYATNRLLFIFYTHFYFQLVSVGFSFILYLESGTCGCGAQIFLNFSSCGLLNRERGFPIFISLSYICTIHILLNYKQNSNNKLVLNPQLKHILNSIFDNCQAIFTI